VKLAPILGLTLGWVSIGSALAGLLAAFVVGAATGLAMLLLRRASRRSAIPFGPFLLLGAAIGLALGDVLTTAYLSLVGLD
jgi:leader peptidase (prepilin peptidase)/N-methyltransferase